MFSDSDDVFLIPIRRKIMHWSKFCKGVKQGTQLACIRCPNAQENENGLSGNQWKCLHRASIDLARNAKKIRKTQRVNGLLNIITGRIQMRVLTTLPSFFLIFLFPLYILRKSKLCNRWRIIFSI